MITFLHLPQGYAQLPYTFVLTPNNVTSADIMEVLLGGALVGAAAWLAKKLSRLRHRKRNRRFLAQAGALEDAYGRADGYTHGRGGEGEERGAYGQARLEDRPQGQHSPALIQAGLGVGAMDHPAHYAALAAASDDAIRNGRARAGSQHTPGAQRYGYGGQEDFRSGPIIEEIGTLPWQERGAYDGRAVTPVPVPFPQYSSRPAAGRPMLQDGVQL